MHDSVSGFPYWDLAIHIPLHTLGVALLYCMLGTHHISHFHTANSMKCFKTSLITTLFLWLLHSTAAAITYCPTDVVIQWLPITVNQLS